MKKRATALVLAMSMILAGCSQGNTAQETTEAAQTETQETTKEDTAKETTQETEKEEEQLSQAFDQVKGADVVIVGAGPSLTCA